MFKVLLVGAGAIGSRHLQGLCRLPGDSYEIWVLEPTDASWETAKKLWDQIAVSEVVTKRPMLTRVRAVVDLPREAIDVAIVATQADIRARVTEGLLKEKSIKNLLLEKVLFQRLADYDRIERLLEQDAVKCWVNCPRRMWPGYTRIKDAIANCPIKSMSVTGSGWDLGCNGVHFVDLFAFLAGSESVIIDAVHYEGIPKPAKREGVLHISGTVSGYINSACGSSIHISAQSLDAPLGGKILEISFLDGSLLRVEEHSSKMRWSFEPEISSSWQEDEIRFQSVLTDVAVMEILNEPDPKLTPYNASKGHHLALLSIFCDTLSQFNLGLEADCCPVT